MVIAEIRDAEAPAFLSTCSNGHYAPLTTIHASSPEGALGRITSLAHRHGCQDAQTADFYSGKFNFVEMRREPKPHVTRVSLGTTLHQLKCDRVP
jgi:Flp pilus assembly CpaF family ATPase